MNQVTPSHSHASLTDSKQCIEYLKFTITYPKIFYSQGSIHATMAPSGRERSQDETAASIARRPPQPMTAHHHLSARRPPGCGQAAQTEADAPTFAN